MKFITVIAVAIAILGCSPAAPEGGDTLSVLLTKTEIRALVLCADFGPYSSYFEEDATLRAALNSARNKMVGLQ